MCKTTEGIEKTYFYHLRDDKKRPVVTICLLKDFNGRVHRGISICSPRDFPRKVVGRGIAYSRALSAYNQELSDSVALRYEAIEVIDSLTEVELVPLINQYIVKSVYNAKLTDFEKKITRT